MDAKWRRKEILFFNLALQKLYCSLFRFTVIPRSSPYSAFHYSCWAHFSPVNSCPYPFVIGKRINTLYSIFPVYFIRTLFSSSRRFEFYRIFLPAICLILSGHTIVRHCERPNLWLKQSRQWERERASSLTFPFRVWIFFSLVCFCAYFCRRESTQRCCTRLKRFLSERGFSTSQRQSVERTHIEFNSGKRLNLVCIGLFSQLTIDSSRSYISRKVHEIKP